MGIVRKVYVDNVEIEGAVDAAPLNLDVGHTIACLDSEGKVISYHRNYHDIVIKTVDDGKPIQMEFDFFKDGGAS